MLTLQLNDSFIEQKFEMDFHNNTKYFIQTIKSFLQKKDNIEFNLLKAYSRGELSSGQVARILDISKYDVLELMERYDIAYINVDDEYLKEEIEASDRFLSLNLCK